jgi:uncharacterized protein (DUF1800 family)
MNIHAIALNRFGLGVRVDEPPPANAQRWLLSQFDSFEPLSPAWKPLQGTAGLVGGWLAQQRAVRQAPPGERSGIREAYLRQGRDAYIAAVGARTSSALQASAPFLERLVHFWSNHFAVSVDKLLVVGLAGAFERDAIRPHVLGRFEDLLVAVVRHPAMMLYLDQAQSLGPASLAGRRARPNVMGQRRGGGLNENLAREILELHTLGVRGGYAQEDVTEFARALTGWTLPSDEPGSAAPASFRFVSALHEPGVRVVRGRIYADSGEQQARDIMHDLSIAPATARHIALKLARHLVADDPPPAMVQRLADTFEQTGGDLPSLYRELVASPEAWQPATTKFKTPWEWAISGLRALGRQELAPVQATALMNQLGQPVWRPGAPAGYDDVAATWAAPDALLRRVEAAQRLAMLSVDATDARALGPQVLLRALSETTADAIARAESGATALALLLVSPEFMRR